MLLYVWNSVAIISKYRHNISLNNVIKNDDDNVKINIWLPFKSLLLEHFLFQAQTFIVIYIKNLWSKTLSINACMETFLYKPSNITDVWLKFLTFSFILLSSFQSNWSKCTFDVRYSWPWLIIFYYILISRFAIAEREMIFQSYIRNNINFVVKNIYNG